MVLPKKRKGSDRLKGANISPIPKTINPLKNTRLRPMESPKLPKVKMTPILANKKLIDIQTITLGSVLNSSAKNGRAILVILPSNVLVNTPNPTTVATTHL